MAMKMAGSWLILSYWQSFNTMVLQQG